MADGGPVRFARAWAAAVVGTCYLPMEPAELEAFLVTLTGRLAACLHGEPCPRYECQQIGAALVAAHLTSPEGFGRTVEVVQERLLPELGLTGDHWRGRLAHTLGAVATGYARALRDRTLDEQEAIRRAALMARQQAEVALRASEARFRYQATHDPLTDLPNRTLFTTRLTDLLAPTGAAPRRIGLCFVDLDGFKAVNDTLGHYIGDLLLVAVAGRLRQVLPDQLVARLSGDEFVILVADTNGTDDLVKVADTALSAIAQPTQVDGHELTISASVGLVERDATIEGPSELMRAADDALRWAKSAGRGRWELFDPARSSRERTRRALSAALPRALERGELFLEYQPLVSLASGRLVGLEALLRWRHPQLGVLCPDRFVGLAEETGLIIRVGGWALAEACRQAAGWARFGPDPPFASVNLAARQVRDPDLLDTVTAALDRSGLAPDRLQLEITESAVIGTDDEPVRVLRRLTDLGIRVAIDDFGTGYANLAYLRRLPVGELKLAGSFVEGLRQGATAGPATDEQILTTIVSLAHTLGMTVTAEGVETSTQAERLRAIGCDTAQGWHFGRPAPADHLADLIRPTAPVGGGGAGDVAAS